MTVYYKLFFAHIFVFCSFQGYAQKDSVKQSSDSVNTVILQNFNAKQAVNEKQRIADSVKKAQLETQLGSLKLKDSEKKENLVNQLEALQDKERKRIAQKKAEIDALRKTARAYPVSGFFNDTLFIIYSRLGSFSAQERAEAVTHRVSKLADNFRYRPDSLVVVPAETIVDIRYGENIISSVSENDAIWHNTSKEKLAGKYRNIINREVLRYKKETSFSRLAEEIGLALLVLIVIGLLIYFIGRFFRYTAAKIRSQENKRINGIRIRSYTLFDAHNEVEVLLSINTLLKWVVIVIMVYITLPILFGIFPWTKDFAETMFGYVLNPLKKIAQALWNYLPNLVTILVIIVVFHYVMRLVRFIKTEIANEVLKIPGFYADWANPTYQIVRVLIYAFMIVVIFPYLPGSESPIFRGVSVFLGFLFTFGSAGSLSNVVAGLVLTYMRLFKLGNRVKIGDVTGDVIEKSMLVTRIRTIKNEIISIPNSTVMNSHTVNYSSDAPDRGLIIHTTVTMGYDVSWRLMHELLVEAALRTELILHDPPPFVLQTSLDDYYVSYQVNAYTRHANKQAGIYSELHQHIQDVCHERGLELLSPHFRAMRDGSRSQIPPEYTPAADRTGSSASTPETENDTN